MISDYVLGKFPRSSKYDLTWMMSCEMGPNAMWLAEFLTNGMNIKPGMRVLDLGCGKAVSSVFIAQEFSVKVWASDLWIAATENFQTIVNHNLEENVYPIYAEAHSLPFAENYFDVIICIDAYHYFGTDDQYLTYLLKFLKQGGQFGIVVPGFVHDADDEIKKRFAELWDNGLHTLKPLQWWDNQIRKMDLLDITCSDNLPDGYRIWYEWEQHLTDMNMINPQKGSDIGFLEADRGDFTCFNRIIGIKK